MKIIYILLVSILTLFATNIQSNSTGYKDIRYVTATILKLRDKPSIHSKQVGFLRYDEKVTVIEEHKDKSPYNWVLTTRGYTSSNYLSRKMIISTIQEVNLEEKLNTSDFKHKKIKLKKDEFIRSDYINKLFGLDY